MASGKTRKRRLVITELDEVRVGYILVSKGRGICMKHIWRMGVYLKSRNGCNL